MDEACLDRAIGRSRALACSRTLIKRGLRRFSVRREELAELFCGEGVF